MVFIDRLINALVNLHPLHTMVVHFPIGLTGAALFFIILAMLFKSTILEEIAFADLALATFSIIAAGLTGMRDNINIYAGDAPNANVKIILAGALLIISVLTLIWRWKNPGIFTTKSTRRVYINAFL
ncbi:MAG: DUF2231 domain-containing protein [Chloroflexota bacterium]